MSRPAKKFSDPKKQKAHDAALARRRKNHHERIGLGRAVEASVGEANFEELVAVEKLRLSQKDEKKVAAAKMSPNRVAAARENLTLAFDLMGGVPALVAWGRKNQTEFYRLWARLIPKESMELSATLPLEALLAKLASREGETVMEAARLVGEDFMEEARHRVIDQDTRGLPSPDFGDDEEEETIQ